MLDLRGYRRPAIVAAASGTAAGILVAIASLTPLSSLDAVVPVALVVAASVGISILSRNRMIARLEARFHRLSLDLATTDRSVREVGAIATMATTSGTDLPYPLPLGGKWALGWDGAIVLMREIVATRPNVVVELGSGASSVLIGLQLRAAGHGHLYTLDHEPEYAAVTRRHVAAFGLESWITVLDAPLVDTALGDEHFRWYRLPPEMESLGHIDVVVVDGPPQKTDPIGSPRYPAVPVLGDRLGTGSVVYVDDAGRDGERRMIDRWLHDEPRWQLETIPTIHGTAILRWPG